LLWSHDEGGRVALGFEDIEGRMPAQPWRDDELRMVVDGLQRLHDVLTPSPIASSTAADAFAGRIKGWRELKELQAEGLDPWSQRNLDRLVELEAKAPLAVAGRTLLNFDIRADNILLAGDRVYFVRLTVSSCWRSLRGLACVRAIGVDARGTEAERVAWDRPPRWCL